MTGGACARALLLGESGALKGGTGLIPPGTTLDETPDHLDADLLTMIGIYTDDGAREDGTRSADPCPGGPRVDPGDGIQAVWYIMGL
jgi:hypothetical protein